MTRSGHYHLALRPRPDEPLRRGMDRLIEEAMRDVPAGARVLDVGTGLGGSLRVLAALGLRAVGIDPDVRMAAWAAGHAPPGVEVRHARLEDVDDGPFDALLLTEVLQHHRELDPLLRACRARLSRGGLIAVHDPALCAPATWDEVPHHPRGALAAAAARTGLAVVEARDLTDDVAGTFPRLVGRLERRRGALLERSSEPERLAGEIQELASHLRALGAAFRAGWLRYERTLLRAS